MANRSTRSRIAAKTFRVTEPWASSNVIDPLRYLADVLRRLPATPPDGLAELLPDVWFLAHQQAVRKRAAVHASCRKNRSLVRILGNQGCSHEFLGRRLFAPDGRATWRRLFLAPVDVTGADCGRTFYNAGQLKRCASDFGPTRQCPDRLFETFKFYSRSDQAL
jgi:hypothetical protein